MAPLVGATTGCQACTPLHSGCNNRALSNLDVLQCEATTLVSYTESHEARSRHNKAVYRQPKNSEYFKQML